jgi:hypothetical protein
LRFSVNEPYRNVLATLCPGDAQSRPGDDEESPIKIYNDSVTAAKKLLGKDGELPKPRVDVPKTVDEGTKVLGVLIKNREEMEKTAIGVETAVAKVKAVAKQYGDMINGDHFELDPKDAKQKKIIAAVSGIDQRFRRRSPRRGWRYFLPTFFSRSVTFPSSFFMSSRVDLVPSAMILDMSLS